MFAQAADPLAPLPTTGRQAAAVSAPTLSATQRRRSVSRSSVQPVGRRCRAQRLARRLRCDRRRQLGSAQAGIAALPPSVLTPVAKAELYTAKGSPVVDVASLQALIAEAPELPEAEPARG